MQRIKQLIKKIGIWYICISISLFNLFFTMEIKAATPVTIQNDLWVGEDGDIFFQTRDKNASSATSIRYQTIGFTITKCTLETKNPEESIFIPIQLGTYTEILDGNGYITTTFKISQSEILTKIGSRDASWLADINSEKACYLKFDAIMITIEEGIVSGNMDSNGNYYINTESPKPGVYDKNSIEALKSAYAWSDPDAIDTHFNKYLLYSGSVEETITTSHTGTSEFSFKTGNTSDLFDLSKSIPTSEDITNKIQCDKWYGNMSVGKVTLSRNYSFPYLLKWQEWNPYKTYNPITGTYTGGYDSHQVRITITVPKKATFYYVQDLNVYSFSGATILNGVYPGNKIEYGGADVAVSTAINGVDNKIINYRNYYIEARHVKWARYSGGTVTMDAGTAGYDAAYDMALQDAKLDEKPGLVKTEARNDSVTIDGVCYMDGNWKQLDQSNNYTTNGWTSFPSAGGYPQYTDEKTVTIPSTVANDTYKTRFIAHYTNRTSEAGDTDMEGTTILPDHVIEEYRQNEPVRIHTPVISPVKVTDAETETQLINPIADTFQDGQLILDNYYVFHWDSAIHRNILGYGDSGDPSKYDKYVLKKEMKFPFDVYYKGSYMKANAWFTIEKADWQDTQIYIPPWAEELNSLIQYRVTAENVLDETDEEVNERISKKENLANVTVDIDGSGKNYVATYQLSVQTSGILYGFEIDGVNNKDYYKSDLSGNLNSLQDYSLAQNKEELKVGTKNRAGGNSIRYTVDNSLKTNWDNKLTLPIGVDENKQVYSMETGLKFSYQVRSMANLGDDIKDAVYIIPSYRYVKGDGTVLESDQIKIYYSDDTGIFKEYGTTVDLTNIKTTALNDDLFEGSVYDYGDGSLVSNLHNKQLQYTVEKDSTLQGITLSEFLSKRNINYNLSNIQMLHTLRVLSGDYAQTKIAASGEGNLGQTSYQTLAGVDADHNSVIYDKFIKSMQTWHGEYEIPENLFICESSIDLEDYALNHDLNENSDIWLTDGYAILNFYIYSKNNGISHLQYFPKTAGYNTSDMWKIEGGKESFQLKNGTSVSLRSGDIAVIDMSKSRNDRYKTGIFMIN